jgi:hypothetical protein
VSQDVKNCSFESALDMFNWKKSGKNSIKMGGAPFGASESMTFYLGGASGK